MCVLRQKFPVSIIVEVTSTFGDPDLYLSTTNAHPTVDSAEFISADLGDDVVLLNSNHPEWNADHPMLFIGVFGRTKSDFNIQVTVDILFDERAANAKYLRLRGMHARRRGNIGGLY